MGIIEGALILAAGILLGRYLPARKKTPEPVKPVCGCTHHYSMHDPGTGKCSAAVQISRYDAAGNWIGYDHPACACRRYSGPEPLPSYYATEIAGSQP